MLRVSRRFWRRSLQLRVVATTLLLGLVVVLAVGNFLLVRITNGLIDSRRDTAEAESLQKTREAKDLIKAKNYSDGDSLNVFLNQLVGQLEAPGDPSSRLVVIEKTLISQSGSGVPARSSQGIQASAIPRQLRREVDRDPERLQSQLVTVSITDPGGTTQEVRAIIWGTQIDLGQIADGEYELFYVYRLDREVEILDLVRRTFVAGAVALVMLVGAVAFVVTSQVVAPVRQAARTAEGLASGRLDLRMPVHGEDDLARLGRAFNEMAAGLERQIHQLEELSRVQRRFVSDVSHELRTPLTTIRMAGEVMYEARSEFDPTVARTAELLQNQVDRFESLLVDLLEVSRFDAGAAVLELEPTDVREVVTRVVEGLTPLADRKETRLVIQAPHGPCLAEIDSRRVERIVRNLVGNAIEHGESRPVEITVAADSDAVAVAVRDHGVGLDEGETEMVFSRFWRADPARARTTGGTGLGLAIALEDALLHGGWLQVWGARGQGALFRLTLPRHSGADLTDSPLPLVPREEPGPPPDRRPSAPGPKHPAGARRSAPPAPPATPAAPATAAPAEHSAAESTDRPDRERGDEGTCRTDGGATPHRADRGGNRAG
ncbi:MAG: two-component system, OmpR family, sensor histidine kinase MtrB [Actinomycetota bacterium]|nr:two-component system, OmpR family, sensor histidine kinase MtrB [Actinomycetota bacterium]